MISRAGSDASSNLRRSKSASSVQQRRKHPLLAVPVDPDTARTHALIAARLAANRSRRHASSSDAIARLGSNASRQHYDSRSNRTPGQTPQSRLHRQRSTLQERAGYTTPRITPLPPPSYNDVYSYQQSLSVADAEFGLAGESYGAEPSSFRKVRRARSAQTPLRRMPPVESTTSQECRPSPIRTLRRATSSVVLSDSKLRLRLKRSFNFLRLSRKVEDTSAYTQSQYTYHPEALSLAKSQFAHAIPPPHLAGKTSQPILSRSHGRDRVFRKSLRSSQHEEITPAEATRESSPSVTIQKPSLAESLRNRLKRTFNRPKNPKGHVPPQSVEATRPYFSEDFVNSRPDTGLDSYYDGDAESSRRQSLYIPSSPPSRSMDGARQFPMHLISSNSLESIRSNERSRVTSWTNSTIADSVCVQPITYERKRLSVIKEDGGPHQPSSSVGRHIGGVSALHRPLRDGHGIDSRRLYSALVKRIDEEEAELQHTQAALEDIHEAQAECNRRYPFLGPTIRAVNSQSSLSSRATDDAERHQHVSTTRLWQEAPSAMTPEQHRQNVERRKQRLLAFEAQSSYFPFSSDHKSSTLEPLKKLIKGKRIENNDRISSTGPSGRQDLNNLTQDSVPLFQDRNFSSSLGSVYSKTTDGEINADYVSPQCSADELASACIKNGPGTGMGKTTVLPQYGMATVEIPSEIRGSTVLDSKAPTGGVRAGSVEALVLDTQRRPSESGTHTRENARLAPDQAARATSLRTNPDGVVDGELRSSSRAAEAYTENFEPSKKSRLPSQKVIRATNTVPSFKSTLSTKAGIGPRERASAYDIRELSHGASKGENCKPSALYRSPSRVAKIIQERRSQPALTSESTVDDDCSRTPRNNGQAVSASARSQLQARSGNTRREGIQQQTETQFTKSETSPVSVGPTRNATQESPSERFKNALSARLSRPFDMDCPASNRPFDSMYLGKRETSLAEMKANNRLSVAPLTIVTRSPKTYGDLGKLPFNDDSAYAADDAHRNTSASTNATDRSVSSRLATHGRRMVSNFLKSKKNVESQDSHPNKEIASSPVFI